MDKLDSMIYSNYSTNILN